VVEEYALYLQASDHKATVRLRRLQFRRLVTQVGALEPLERDILTYFAMQDWHPETLTVSWRGLR
jgi:hypothetical protein